MSGLKFLDRLLLDGYLRAQALEFLRVIASDRSCRLKFKMENTRNHDGALGALLHEARSTGGLPTIEEYLTDGEKKDFAKLFLLCLISSVHSFQPNNQDGWEPFEELINELLWEEMIVDPSGGAELQKGDINEYILEPNGELYIIGGLKRLGRA